MAQRIERKFFKPTQISKHLYCPICTEVFYDSVRLFCGYNSLLQNLNSLDTLSVVNASLDGSITTKPAPSAVLQLISTLWAEILLLRKSFKI